MKTKIGPAISNKGEMEFATGVVKENALANVQAEYQQHRECWLEIMDSKLLKWVINPQELEDDGLKAPSREIIIFACKFAFNLCEQNCPPPLRVVPTGSGGIVFEFKKGLVFETYEIHEKKMLVYSTFRDSHLESREFYELK